MQSDPALNTALQNVGTPDNAFDIAYHMWWPSGSDPFYLANTVDNTARKNYYSISGTPTQICDGTIASWPSMQSTIESRLLTTSHIWLDLSTAVIDENIEVTCTAVTDFNTPANLVIHIVLLDRYSYLPSSPNGQPHHYHAMLKMAPSASGQVFTATAEDTVRYYATIHMNPSWNPDNLDIACFVQDNTNHEVLQARCEQVPVNYPSLSYSGYTVEDDGNNDGRPEPGETASLYVTLSNGEPFQTAVNVTGTISTLDPDLTVSVPTVNFPDIPNGGEGTNATPFVFTVSPNAQPHLASFHLEVVADPLQTTMEADFDIYIGWPNCLLVDDDLGGVFESYYEAALNSLSQSYELWDANANGAPNLDQAGYAAVIWFTGYSDFEVLNASEQAALEGYLADGGRLFLSGQNIAQGLHTGSPDFLNNVLHADWGANNTQVKILNGVAGNPVGDGLLVNCNTGGQGSGSCTSPDGISVLPPAQEAFIYENGMYRGGLTYEDDVTGAKLVYFSFPFEAINGQSGSSTQVQVLQAILDFFGPASGVETGVGTPVHHMLVRAYPNPFNPTAVIGFDLPAASRVRIEIFDVTGKPVGGVTDGWFEAGSHEANLDGRALASGIYVYRLHAGDYSTGGKLVLMK